ncbi:MAG: glycosyltransferase [Desulfocapsaceae bacterium]|nr:glycosyltransferase [Desulfocapsaceae bacterium]
MKISISFATIRKGWIENTIRCLGRQTLTHKDWELVMIDDIPEDRSDYVLELAQKENINVKWMRSKTNHWKSNRLLGNARNTGFIHSDGELIVFLDDYTWVPETFLEEHWNRYKETGNGIIGRVKTVKYQDPVNSQNDLTIIGEDDRYNIAQKNGYNAIPNPLYGWFYTFNASAPLEALIKINGYDEEFDATGEDDIDLGERLTRIGINFKYIMVPKITVFHMQHGGKNPPHMGCGGQFNIKGDLAVCSKCGFEVKSAFATTYDLDIKTPINLPDRYGTDDVHKVPRTLYNTIYDGCWGLLERNQRRNPCDVNLDYFDLKEARKFKNKYPFKSNMEQI